MMLEKHQIPPGYRQNAQGHLIPEDSISPKDLLRDQTVTELMRKAVELQQQQIDVKSSMMSDLEAFLRILHEQHDVLYQPGRGNVTLRNFEDTEKVQLAIADQIGFNEEIHVAKAIIDECIQNWSSDSNKQIKSLIEHAFQVDKQDKLNTYRILSLIKLDLDDEKWTRAMDVLKNAIEVLSTRSYLRFYRRENPNDPWKAVVLDFSRTPIQEPEQPEQPEDLALGGTD
jgi:hypothetical protein